MTKDYWLANPENLKAAQARLTDQDKEDEKATKLRTKAHYMPKQLKKSP